MAGPELILTTVNCSLEQAKPKSKDHCVQFYREHRDNPNIQSSSRKARHIQIPWSLFRLGYKEVRTGRSYASDNCKPELKKKHVALPPGPSLRNPSNWWFPMEKVAALLTVYPWPIWETALAKITSLLISLAGGGSDSLQLKEDWGGK